MEPNRWLRLGFNLSLCALVVGFLWFLVMVGSAATEQRVKDSCDQHQLVKVKGVEYTCVQVTEKLKHE